MSRAIVRLSLFRGTPAPFLAAVLLLLCAGCRQQVAPVAESSNPATGVVETATAHSQKVVNQLVIPARVAPDPTRVVHVFSQISGRLLQLFVRPGQEVTQGQRIGLIQSSDVASARSDYEKAKIEALRADRQLDRAKLLLQHEVVAQKDFEDLQAASQAAHSEMNRTEQRIRMLGFSVEGNSDTAILKAPITGVVLDIGTATGEFQKSLDNAASIATIANLDEVWVLGDVYERDLASVKMGSTVDIAFPAYPEEVLHGRIANVSDAIDPTSLTLKVRVVVNNRGHRYKPLMYSMITISRSTFTAFVLPSASVIHDGATSYVFVQQSPGRYEKRLVTTGQARGNTVEITSGIRDGEPIVTTGAALLRAPAGN